MQEQQHDEGEDAPPAKKSTAGKKVNTKRQLSERLAREALLKGEFNESGAGATNVRSCIFLLI